MASARSCVPGCWQAVTTGFPTLDSSSSSMRASTSRACGSLPLPYTRTGTPWGSPQDAGWSFANNMTQGTTIPPSATEQRAWYDTLRDLVPSIVGLQPTVRLYARDRVWCSLDLDSEEDRNRFSDPIHQGGSRSRRTTVEIPRPTARSESSLRAALVFPQVAARSSNGVPPNGAGAQRPDVPTADLFAGEAVDFVLFPEGYVSACTAPGFLDTSLGYAAWRSSYSSRASSGVR